MANDWGQGSNKNIIGFGQATANNEIGWGASHYVSWSEDTDIIGAMGVANLAFQTRVAADSGTFEANDCVINTLIDLNKIQ